MNLQEIRDKIVATLEADATVQSYLGASPRIYYEQPPQALPTLPCCTYHFTAETPNSAMDEYGDTVVQLQIDLWDTGGPDDLEAASEAITKALWDKASTLSSTNYRVRRVRRTGGGMIFTGVMQGGREVLQLTQTWVLAVNDKAY